MEDPGKHFPQEAAAGRAAKKTEKVKSGPTFHLNRSSYAFFVQDQVHPQYLARSHCHSLGTFLRSKSFLYRSKSAFEDQHNSSSEKKGNRKNLRRISNFA